MATKRAIGMITNTKRNTRNVKVARSWPLKSSPIEHGSPVGPVVVDRDVVRGAVGVGEPDHVRLARHELELGLVELVPWASIGTIRVPASDAVGSMTVTVPCMSVDVRVAVEEVGARGQRRRARSRGWSR